MFALHAGIAIENARLHEQVQRLAVVDERERISKDLHDGIIQNLYAVGLSLEDVPELMADDPPRPEAASSGRSIRSTWRSATSATSSSACGRSCSSGAALVGGLAALADEYRHNTHDRRRAQTPGSPATDLAGRGDRPAPGDRQRGAQQHRPPLARRRRAASELVAEDGDGVCELGSSDNGVGFDPARLARLGPPGPGQHARRGPHGSVRRLDDRQRAGRRDAVIIVVPRASVRRSRGQGDRMPDADSTARRLRLLVVDDHEVVRQGLVALLEPARASSRSWPRRARSPRPSSRRAGSEPDLVVMDVRLPDGSGIEACREIRAEMPATRVVMLTSYPDEEAVLSAIIAGASGYLLKQIRARDLVAALEAVGRGESLLDPAVTGQVLERVRRIATGGRARRAGPADPAGAEDPAARGRGQDQQGDRRPRSSCRTRPSRTTSARSSPSSTSSAAPRPPPTWPGSAARHGS